MSDLNSAFEQARLRRKRQYELKYKIYKLLSTSKEEVAAGRIINWLRKRYFKQPDNIDPDQLESIPGIFRFRTSVDDMNLVKPVPKPISFNRPKRIKRNRSIKTVVNVPVQDDISKVMEESKKLVMESEQNLLDEAIKASLQDEYESIDAEIIKSLIDQQNEKPVIGNWMHGAWDDDGYGINDTEDNDLEKVLKASKEMYESQNGIDKILQESIRTFNEQNDNVLKTVLAKSNEEVDEMNKVIMKNIIGESFQDINTPENEVIDGSNELQQAIEQSLKWGRRSSIESIQDSEIDIDSDSDQCEVFESPVEEHVMETSDPTGMVYNVCLDMRIYGVDPFLPIHIDGKDYYLSEDQIVEIQQKWNEVNPDTTQGKEFEEDLKYYYMEYNHMKKNNLFKF